MCELNITLVRMYDPPDPRNASFERLLSLLDDSDVPPGERSEALERAKELFAKRKGDHRLQRLEDRRHRLLAHTAVEDDSQQKAQFQDVRSFVDGTLALLNELNYAITGKRKPYDVSNQFWSESGQLFWRQFGTE